MDVNVALQTAIANCSPVCVYIPAPVSTAACLYLHVAAVRLVFCLRAGADVEMSSDNGRSSSR